MCAQKSASISSLVPLVAALALALLLSFNGNARAVAANADQFPQHEETRKLMALVNDAAELVRTKGDAAFSDFRVSGSR